MFLDDDIVLDVHQKTRKNHCCFYPGITQYYTTVIVTIYYYIVFRRRGCPIITNIL